MITYHINASYLQTKIKIFFYFNTYRNLTSGVLERSRDTGFALTFMAKDLAESSTSHFLLFQERMNGFQLSRNEGNLIRMSLSADDFIFECEFHPKNYGNASIWHHYGVSFRILPSPKLSCYVDGHLYRTQFQKSPRTPKGNNHFELGICWFLAGFF